MKERMTLRNALFFPALLATLSLSAQQRFQAGLPPVGATGFYRVVITPEVTAHSAPDLRDLRLLQKRGGEVPYLHSADADAFSQNFRSFQIAKKGKTPAGNTEIVLHSGEGQALESFTLLIRNTDAQRAASVSGSNDGQNFFSLRDSALLTVEAQRGDTGLLSISLPRTAYAFLRLEIFERGLLPLEILGAGIFETGQTVARFVPVPGPDITRKDSGDHKTYFRLRFAKPYRIDRLRVSASAGVPLFKRTATLFADGTPVAYFTLDHTGSALAWAQTHTAELWVVVDNEDNPPLANLTVGAEQQGAALICFLEKGERYALQFGDSALVAALYDLRHFRDSIQSRALPPLQPGPVEALKASQIVAAKKEPLIGERTMWLLIVLVLGGLLLATMGLVRQIKRKA